MLTMKMIPFLAFFRAPPEVKESAKHNLTPKAQCHNDVARRLSFDTIRKRFEQKINIPSKKKFQQDGKL
jgi:hypothetical protein